MDDDSSNDRFDESSPAAITNELLARLQKSKVVHLPKRDTKVSGSIPFQLDSDPLIDLRRLQGEFPPAPKDTWNQHPPLRLVGKDDPVYELPAATRTQTEFQPEIQSNVQVNIRTDLLEEHRDEPTTQLPTVKELQKRKWWIPQFPEIGAKQVEVIGWLVFTILLSVAGITLVEWGDTHYETLNAKELLHIRPISPM